MEHQIIKNLTGAESDPEVQSTLICLERLLMGELDVYSRMVKAGGHQQ